MREVKVHFKGANLDNAIRKLSSKARSLKNIKRIKHDELEFCVDKNDLPLITSMSKYFECKVENDKGIIKKYLASFLAIVVVLPFVLLFAVSSSRVLWRIEIETSGQINKQEILEILKEHDVYKGKKIKVDAGELERILLQNDRVAQCSCVYVGTTLKINISEKLVYHPKTYEPLRASFSGVIQKIDGVRGELNCRVGDFVSKGDILVLPYIKDREGNNISVEPYANIEGLAYISATACLNSEEKVLKLSGKQKVCTKICWNFKQKSNFSAKPFVFYELKVYNKYISSVLPIVKQKLVYCELIEDIVQHDLVEEREDNESLSHSLAYESLPSGAICLKEKTMSVVANNTLFSTTTLCFEWKLV